MSHGKSSGISELAFLVLALLLVGMICMPLWHWSATGNEGLLFNAERLGRMFLGWEQAGEYVCFLWASFILLQHWLRVRRQRRGFALEWFQSHHHQRFLPEDSPGLQRHVEDVDSEGRYWLGKLLKLALEKFMHTNAPREASEAVRTWAEIEAERQANALSTVHYLAWAIPALGFVGTVRGISTALAAAPVLSTDSQQAAASLQEFLKHTSYSLAIAFDTTFVALLLSLVLMYALHRVQRLQEDLVLDCQEYVLTKLIARLYDIQLLDEELMEVRKIAGDEIRTRPPKG